MKFLLEMYWNFSYCRLVFGVDQISSKALKRFFESGLYLFTSISLLMPLVFCVHANGQMALETPHAGHHGSVQHDFRQDQNQNLDQHSHAGLPCADSAHECHDSRVVAETESSLKIQPAAAVFHVRIGQELPAHSGGALWVTSSTAPPSSLSHLRTIILIV